MTPEERHEQILLYVAGQLDPAEENDVRAYLAGRDVLSSAALAEAEGTVRELLLSVTPVATDAALRDRLMQRIQSVKTDDVSRHPAMRLEPTDQHAKRHSHRSIAWPAVAAVAAALAVAAGGLYAIERATRQRETAQLQQVVTNLNTRINTTAEESAQLQQVVTNLTTRIKSTAEESAQLRQVVTNLNSRIKSTVEESASLKTALVQLQQSTEVLGAENLKLVSLGGNESPASGRIFWDRTHGRWTVSVFKLKPLPPEQVYELWFINKQGQPMAAGAIEVDASGNGLANVPLPANLEVASAGITAEARTSKLVAPTPPIHLSGKVE